MGETSVHVLAEAILEVFAEGIRVDRCVQDYVNATFSHPCPETLQDILGDENNCERDPLEQLLFSPDASVQEQLEPLLETLELGPADGTPAAQQVAAASTATRFWFPDGRSLSLSITDERAAIFVAGLRVHRCLHPDMRNAINGRVGKPQRNRLKVRLRNAARPVPKTHHHFWKQFFAQFGHCQNELDGFFETALYVLDNTSDLAPPDAFHRYRVFCRQALDRVGQDQALCQGKNIETLIMAGHRPPHADPTEIHDRLDKIDRICRHLFGGVLPAPDGDARGETRGIETMEDLARLVKRLS
jgi:hypothetical protein